MNLNVSVLLLLLSLLVAHLSKSAKVIQAIIVIH